MYLSGLQAPRPIAFPVAIYFINSNTFMVLNCYYTLFYYIIYYYIIVIMYRYTPYYLNSNCYYNYILIIYRYYLYYVKHYSSTPSSSASRGSCASCSWRTSWRASRCWTTPGAAVGRPWWPPASWRCSCGSVVPCSSTSSNRSSSKSLFIHDIILI